MSSVPTIDISAVDDHTLQQIDAACRDHGFFKLVGHGLNDLLDDMWRQCERFFAAPQEFKYSLMRPADSAFGYFNREMTKLKRDQKETFDYNGLNPDHSNSAMKNRWPENTNGPLADHELAQFEATLKAFYSATAELAMKPWGWYCRHWGKMPMTWRRCSVTSTPPWRASITIPATIPCPSQNTPPTMPWVTWLYTNIPTRAPSPCCTRTR